MIAKANKACISGGHVDHVVPIFQNKLFNQMNRGELIIKILKSELFLRMRFENLEDIKSILENKRDDILLKGSKHLRESQNIDITYGVEIISDSIDEFLEFVNTNLDRSKELYNMLVDVKGKIQNDEPYEEDLRICRDQIKELLDDKDVYNSGCQNMRKFFKKIGLVHKYKRELEGDNI